MPNYCDFEMKIKGSKENREKLISYLNADYHYDIKDNNEYTLKKCTADKHFFRVFEADEIEEGYYTTSDRDYSILTGSCAWSVVTCMFDDDNGTYYGSWKKNNFYDCKDFRGTHMIEVTKDLDLEVEIFSKEDGCGFMEHYVLNKGELLIEECVDYREEYDEESEEVSEIGGMEWNYTI